MDLAEITTKVAAAVDGDSGLSEKVKFDFGDEGKLFIDGAAGEVSNEDADADAVIKVSLENFKSLATGALDPMQAVMTGKLQVLGDMGVAMKLQSLLSKLS